MARLWLSSQSCKPFKGRLFTALQIPTQNVEETNNFKSLQTGKQTTHIRSDSHRSIEEKCDFAGQKAYNSGILQQSVSSTQVESDLEASYRSEFIESPSKHSYLQNGDGRGNSVIDNPRRVALLDRYKRCLLARSHASKVIQVFKISNNKRCLPIRRSAVRNSHCSSRVHTVSQGGQIDCKVNRGSDASVSGRLASQIPIKTTMSDGCSKINQSSSRIRLGDKFRKIRIDPHSTIRLPWLQFRSRQRPSISNSQENRKVTVKNSNFQNKPVCDSQTTNGSDRGNGMHGESDSIGKTSHEALPMASKEVLEVPRIIGKTDPSIPGTSKTIEMVGEQGKPSRRFTLAPKTASTANIHRCLDKGLGSSLVRQKYLRLLGQYRKSSAHKSVRAKGCLLSSKGFRATAQEEGCPDSFRQLLRGGILKQTGRDKVLQNGHLSLENNGLGSFSGNSGKGQTCSREFECHSRCSVQEGYHYKNRMVPPSSNFRENLPDMVHPKGRHVCDSHEQEIRAVHLTHSGSGGLGCRCSNCVLGPSGGLCLLSSGNSPPVGTKNAHSSLQDDCHSSRMARNVMVLGPSGPINQAPFEAANLELSIESTTQQSVTQQPGVSKSPCVVTGLHDGEPSRLSTEVEVRVKAPQRASSRKVYTARWSIFRDWCIQNKVEVTSPPVSKIADFLLHLFRDKDFKPATIAGYRTAIADGLGSQGDAISSSRTLNRLLASFHRDKPRVDRHIPPWDLSLVLLALTREPFEPLATADLKYLTFKTVFLLALASGKRRSEIHAWLHSSVFFDSNESRVTVSPSPAFLAKNQLASEGPGSVKQVVIPALSPILDPELTEDLSLCPVRCLKIYLDRTKDLRKGKHLLFISLKKGFRKDIASSTISHWLKNTVKIAYERADGEVLQVNRVKAHDVRALSASLAFKGGIPLENILSSCFWRSHGTFTNFYLKDICWHNDKVFRLGPIVAAQHVIKKYEFIIIHNYSHAYINPFESCYYVLLFRVTQIDS